MLIYFCESLVDIDTCGGIIHFVDTFSPKLFLPTQNPASLLPTQSLESLTWDDSYSIAKHLQALYPTVRLEDVSLMSLYHWVIALPEFKDDPELVNETILLSILQEWFEEANPL